MCTDNTLSQVENPGKWFRKNFKWLLLLSFSFAIITCYYHHHTYVTVPNSILASTDHLSVVNGEAMAPMQYRFAPYYIAHGLLQLLVKAGAPNNSLSLMNSYLIIQIILTTITNLLLLSFLGIWFDLRLAVTGLLYRLAINPMAEYHYYHQPGDPWIYLFFLLGFIAIATKREVLLLPIIMAGVLFHESILFLIPAYFLARFGTVPNARIITWTFVLIIAWIAVYAGVRMGFGDVQNYMVDKLEASPYPNIMTENLTSPAGWVSLLFCFNVLWIAVPAAWRHMPETARRMFYIVPLYLLVYFIYGRFVEGRIFMPIQPLFIVAGLTWLSNLTQNAKSTGGEEPVPGE